MFKTWISRVPNLQGASIDRDQAHKTIGRAFQWTGTKSPFLYRVDGDSGSLLVRSRERPAWPFAGVSVMEEVHPWQEGDLVVVDVHMSPYRRGKDQVTGRKKELVKTPEHEVEYVLRRLGMAGLTPLDIPEEDDLVTPDPGISIEHLWVDFRANHRVPLDPRRVRATCAVTDLGCLQRAIIEGVGGKKQFLGFGMLLLYPPDVVR